MRVCSLSCPQPLPSRGRDPEDHQPGSLLAHFLPHRSSRSRSFSDLFHHVDIYTFGLVSFSFLLPPSFPAFFLSLSQNFRIFSLNIFSSPLEETQTCDGLTFCMPFSLPSRLISCDFYIFILCYTCISLVNLQRTVEFQKDLIIDLEKARIYLIRCPLNDYNFTHKFIPHEPAPMTLLYLAQYFKKRKKRKKKEWIVLDSNCSKFQFFHALISHP